MPCSSTSNAESLAIFHVCCAHGEAAQRDPHQLSSRAFATRRQAFSRSGSWARASCGCMLLSRPERADSRRQHEFDVFHLTLTDSPLHNLEHHACNLLRIQLLVAPQLSLDPFQELLKMPFFEWR